MRLSLLSPPEQPQRRHDRLLPSDQLHQRFFASVGSLPQATRRGLAHALFELKYLRPDPWGYRHRQAADLRRAAIVSVCDLEPVGHILEVGCGEGFLTERLIEIAGVRRVTGIDISRRALRRAARRLGGAADLVHGDARRADLPRTGLIVVADFLYYVGDGDNLDSFLNRLVDSLAVGGRLVLAHPLRWVPGLHSSADRNARLRKELTSNSETPNDVLVVEVWRRVA